MNKHIKTYKDLHNLKKLQKEALSEYFKELGRKGGKKSIKSRFAEKTAREISEIMRRVRYGKKRSE